MHVTHENRHRHHPCSLRRWLVARTYPSMNTFTSCGLPWYPWPNDGSNPCAHDQYIRVLSKDEFDGVDPYDASFCIKASSAKWGGKYEAGWYPVNPDGTEITKARPRVIRRRFKLSTK